MVMRAGFDQAKKEFRFLVVVCVLVAAFLTLPNVLERAFDRFVRERPFVTAVVDVRSNPSGAKPTIWYRAKGHVQVKGEWITYLSVSDNRGCGARGAGSYGPSGPTSLKPWPWAEWLGKDCDVPTAPFRACVFYQVEALDTGVHDTTPAFCSEEYDPREIAE